VTSLLSRLLNLFPKNVRREDLFTETVAHLFERDPRLCLEWLKDAGLLSSVATRTEEGQVRVRSQKWLGRSDQYGVANRIDLVIEVRQAVEGVENGTAAEIVMIESKIGSKEGPEQLRHNAEHLDAMDGFASKTLLYITRAHESKDENKILSGLGRDIGFKQLRWRDFYGFLKKVERDALVEEVMKFMEEQGMAGRQRFSAVDIAALSGALRAFEILDETLDEEVRGNLEVLAGRKVRRSLSGPGQILEDEGYFVSAPLTEEKDIHCYAGYFMRTPDGYPNVYVSLEAGPQVAGREAWAAAMKRIALHDEWEAEVPASLEDGPSVWRQKSLTDFLPEKEHVAAVKGFFIESINQLREELAAFKKEHPDLHWTGG